MKNIVLSLFALLALVTVLAVQPVVASASAPSACGGDCTNKVTFACGGCTNGVTLACGSCTNNVTLACGGNTNSVTLALAD